MTDPQTALSKLLDCFEPVETETIAGDIPSLSGCVLAESIGLDRDCPACDVSAMDGFAIRLDELKAGPLPIVGECKIGQPPATVDPGTVKRIYTGSPLPEGADTVLRLERGHVEDTGEGKVKDEKLRLKPGVELAAGADIRRQGENAKRGDLVLPAGQSLTPAAIGAVATIGQPEVKVFRRLRVAVITTGDELLAQSEPGATPPGWRIRDSNGPVLKSMLGALPFVEQVEHLHVEDSLEALADQLTQAAAGYDAAVLTGGVSKGAYDYVPPAVERVGGQIVFHRITARPGQPTLGAVIEGKPVVGLPGNPLAVLCTGRRVVVPLLRKRAGQANPDTPPPTVRLDAWTGKTLSTTWWRPVTMTEAGFAKLASLRGSGDVCGPATTDGFVEVPPDTEGLGPYAYYPWTP